jgi:hypothetical protein
MNWGDVPAWLALVVSLIAIGRSWRAERRAREATAGAASLEVSLQRIADALDRSRVNTPQHGSSVASAQPETRAPRSPAGGSAPPLPEFNVEFVSGHAYRLRNVSTMRATGVTVTLEHARGVTRNLPADAELPPLASTGPFLIQGSLQAPAPGEVLVTCDQLPEPVRVPLPTRG